MYQLEYADIEQDALVDARARERQLLQRSIDLMKTARDKSENSMEVVEATHFSRRLWGAFLEDLAQDENQLPKELRANLISIGIWVLKETERIRLGESTDFDGIIEISEDYYGRGKLVAAFKLSMKPNERVYVNGAVLRFDRKTSVEFLNNVHFLLESHVLQVEDANTPLKRLYFSIQLQLMTPHDTGESRGTLQRTPSSVADDVRRQLRPQ